MSKKVYKESWIIILTILPKNFLVLEDFIEKVKPANKNNSDSNFIQSPLTENMWSEWLHCSVTKHFSIKVSRKICPLLMSYNLTGAIFLSKFKFKESNLKA